VNAGGCHSHRLYSHSCDRTGQRSNHPNKCNQRSKWSRSTFKSQCGTDQISAIHSEPGGGVTHAWNAYFLTYRLADLGCSSNIETSLQANIRAVKSQWPKIRVVNGQTAKKELVKVLTRGHSCDYRVYGSDTPLECTASTSTKYGIQLHSNKVVGRFGILHSPGVMESVTT